MTSDDTCANCGQDIAYGCGCTERERFKAEVADLEAENAKLRRGLAEAADTLSWAARKAKDYYVPKDDVASIDLAAGNAFSLGKGGSDDQ